MTYKENIKVLENELECVKRQCNNFCDNKRDCKHCDLVLEDKIVINAYKEAIQALKNIDKLVDRQWAEIEKLKIENRILSQKRANIFEILAAFEKGEAKGRVDAVKEFVERLCKDRVSNDPVAIAAKAEFKKMDGETR